jgi:hypothetical protein
LTVGRSAVINGKSVGDEVGIEEGLLKIIWVGLDENIRVGIDVGVFVEHELDTQEQKSCVGGLM